GPARRGAGVGRRGPACRGGPLDRAGRGGRVVRSVTRRGRAAPVRSAVVPDQTPESLIDNAGAEPDDGPGETVPAGRVLVVGFVGLLLAALLNADSLVERAESKPFGWGRDVSLAIW